MKTFSLLCLLAALAASPASADPARFLPGIVSDDGAFGLTLSPDGSHAVWTRSGGKRDVLTIMEARKVGGVWQQATVAPFSGKPGWKDIDPMFSPDGRWLLFQSNRPVPDRPQRRGFDIYRVAYQAGGWGQPEHLGHTVNGDDSESYASMAANGNLYFMKANDAAGQDSDIWVAERRGDAYAAPRNLGAPVNTVTARESNPFIAPDESYLIYFSAVGQAQPDLYISFREGGTWSAPRRLAVPINSDEAEFCPFIHQGRLYLSRQRKEGDRFIENVYAYPFDPEDYRSR